MNTTKDIAFARPPKRMPHDEIRTFEHLQCEIVELRLEVQRCDHALHRAGCHELARIINYQDAVQRDLDSKLEAARRLYDTYR